MRAAITLAGAIIALAAVPCEAQQSLCESIKTVAAGLATNDASSLKGDKITDEHPIDTDSHNKALLVLPGMADCEVTDRGDDPSYLCKAHFASAAEFKDKSAEIEKAVEACLPDAKRISHPPPFETLHSFKVSNFIVRC
jgi:hypothetical protein